MQNKKSNLSRNDARWPLLISILLAVLFLAVYLFVVALSDVSPVGTGLILLILYSAVSGGIYFTTMKKLAAIRAENDTAEALNTEIYDLFKYTVDLPYAVVDLNGRIQVTNSAFQAVLGISHSLFKGQLTDYCSMGIKDMLAAKERAAESMEEEVTEKLALRHAIDDLPERERQVIFLRYYKGLTQDRAARVLGVSQVQVSRIEKKAMGKLKERLLSTG